MLCFTFTFYMSSAKSVLLSFFMLLLVAVHKMSSAKAVLLSFFTLLLLIADSVTLCFCNTDVSCYCRYS